MHRRLWDKGGAMKTLEEIMTVIREKNKGYQASKGNTCFYRQDNGNCCLVGAFIPDTLYSPDMEDKMASTIIEQYNLQTFMPFDMSTMDSLQELHDYNLENLEGEKFYQAIEDYIVENELIKAEKK